MKASCAPHPLAAERARAAERQLERHWPFLGDDDNWSLIGGEVCAYFVDDLMLMVRSSYVNSVL